MKVILKIVTLILILILVNIVGCSSKEQYKLDYEKSLSISTDTLKFTDAFYTNYPTSQEDFDEDMKKAVEKIEKNYEMKTKEGKQVIIAYKKFMEYEREFVDDNWEKYDEIENLIMTSEKGIELKKNFDKSVEELRLKSEE